MKEINEKKKRFRQLLSRKGLKYTFERRAICDEVLKLKEHFNADSLYEKFKERGLRVSRDTVYRTLPLLLEGGVIQKSVGKEKGEFFERSDVRGHHDHLVCIVCGKIIEFHCDEIEKIQEKTARRHGFRLIFHDHRLFGYCRNCRV